MPRASLLASADWKTHRIYNIYTPTGEPINCHSQPLQGEIFVPPVASLTYNGTEPAGEHWPVATYRWVGSRQQRDDFVYHTTANAAETPVGFFGGYKLTTLACRFATLHFLCRLRPRRQDLVPVHHHHPGEPVAGRPVRRPSELLGTLGLHRASRLSSA